MSRHAVHVRDATPRDAEELLEVWADLARRAGTDRFTAEPPEVEAATAIAGIGADPDQRLLVGLLDGRLSGAAHLMRAPIAPIVSEQAVHITHLHVLDGYRRQGVGHALVEAAVAWAEEKDTAHILAAASVASRDANRFMARLGLGQIATVRGATVSALRAKLPVEPRAVTRAGGRSHRSVGLVLAQRRSQRRAASKSG